MRQLRFLQSHKWLTAAASLAVTAGLVLLVVSRALAVDLLNGDGGFDTTAQWNGWVQTSDGTAPVTLSQDATTFTGGSNSARLTGSIGARTSGTLSGYLSHPFQVSKATDSLQLSLAYRKDISTTALTSARIDYEVRDAGGSILASGDIDAVAGTAAWSAARTFPLAGLNLAAQADYTLRVGFSATYGRGQVDRVATVWFDSVSLVQDIEPPTVGLVSPSPTPGSYQRQSALTFTWQGTDNVTAASQLEYQYSSDGGKNWSAWTANQTQATVTYAEGAGSFAVRARDAMANVSSPDQRSFTIDLTAPIVAIQAGLANGSVSKSAGQTFTWSGLDNISAPASLLYQYSTDGGTTWSAPSAATQATVTYTEGQNQTFQARSIDQAGNTGAAAGRSFTIDLTGPTVELLSGPAVGAYVGQAEQSFSWQGSDNFSPAASLRYQYSTDGGSTWSALSAATTATVTFAEGPAELQVRGEDEAGNPGPSQACSFTVDLTPPAASAVTATPGITDMTIAFSTAGDPATGRVRYGTLPGQPEATAVEAGPTENHRLVLTGLQPNTVYYYTVEATDRAGNPTVQPEASAATLPDNLPPDTQITAGPADDSWQNGATLTFSFSGTDNVTTAGNLRYSYSADGGSTWSASAQGGSAQIAGYPEGTNQTFLVRAVDEAGNADPTPAQRIFNVDRTGPALSLATAPADGSFVTTTTPPFAWTATDGMADAANLTYATSVDGGLTWSAWTSANTAQPTYAEGRGRAFAVKSRDLAGNQSAVVSRTFSVDVTAPTARITGGLADGAITNVSQQTFSWTGDDNLTEASALAFSTSLDGGVTWSDWTGSAQGTFALPDGQDLTLQVRARDEAGHVSAAASRRFTVDTRAPAISSVALLPQATHADLTWNTTGDPAASVVRWGTAPGTYTASIADSEPREIHTVAMSGLQPGVTYYYVIEATDIAGNSSVTAEASFVTPAAVPHVISTVPELGDPNAGTGVQVKAYFDVDIDPATVSTVTFKLVDSATGVAVAAESVTYDAAARATILVPVADLAPSTGYRVTVTTGVASLEGQHLAADYTWNFTTGLTVFASPHGNFTTNNAACKSCHNTHSSPAAALLSKENVTALCFTCHDGTGSSYDVLGQFTGSAGGGSQHPVKNLPIVSNALLNCSDCHNAHGDKQPDGSLFPRLLRVGLAEGGFAFSGNGVCLACHGPADRQWDASYWAATGGDHTRSTAAHYQDFTALVPASGTGITCVSCHKSHASPSADLLQQPNPETCLGCHENPANSQSSRDIRSEFSGTGVTSRHDVFGTSGAAVSCASCHGPHTVSQGSLADGDTHTALSNPQNTKQDMADATAGATAARRYTDFCLSCHGGNPPTQIVTASTVVPLTIIYPARDVTTNAGGGGTDTAQRSWNKGNYTGSAHYQAGLGCTDCHNSHGSSYDLLQSRPEDTAASGAGGSCGKCHSGAPPAEYATAPNVWPDLNGADDAHRHPTLTISGQHGDTEDLATAGRHAECVDCHDPHTATKASPALNVSGVSPAWGAPWTTPTYALESPAGASYQVCLKCHSSYAFGGTPPATSGGIPATDVAREINPNNASGHAIAGPAKVQTFIDTGVTYYYGKFTGSWSATSAVTCTDCHASTTGVKGPHGSPNPAILAAPFTPTNRTAGTGTGTANTQNDLCFRCHDYGFYAGGTDAGSTTVRSAFSSTNRYNLHAGRHQGQGCSVCHIAVPHGWNSRSLLADILASPDQPQPYFNGAVLSLVTTPNPGEWTKTSCDGCH